MRVQRKSRESLGKIISVCCAILCHVASAQELVFDLNEANTPSVVGELVCEGTPPDQICVSPRGPSCVQKRKVLGISNGQQDEYVIVEAYIGQDIQLDCHYCHEKDQDVPKIWYYNDRLFSAAEREVPQNLELPSPRRKFVVDNNHMLTIRNFSESEGAVYFCQGLHDTSSKFNFLVDVVPNEGRPQPLIGSEKEFKEYFKENVGPVNKGLAKEHTIEIRNWFKLKGEENFDITYEWSSWGGCNSCGRDKGIKKRHGKCRISIPIPSSINETQRSRGPLKKMKFGVQFSCQSLLLDRFISTALVKRIRKLADFVENSKCKGECLIDLSIGKTWKNKIVEMSIWKIVEESLTLTCPRSDLESLTAWVKDGKFFPSKAIQSSGRVTVSVTNKLQFKHLKVEDAGNYTCIVDNEPAYFYDVHVSEKLDKDPDVSWIWTAMGIYSLVAFILWMFLVCIIRRVTKRIQHGYKPLSQIEESDARAYQNLDV